MDGGKDKKEMHRKCNGRGTRELGGFIVGKGVERSRLIAAMQNDSKCGIL